MVVESANEHPSVKTVTHRGVAYAIPYADLLPPLTLAQYEALKLDIARRGIVVPVIIDDHNNVIDGQHRMIIAAELNLAFLPIKKAEPGLTDKQKRELCHDLNVHRRQLTAEERQIAALRLRSVGQSYRQIGETLGIGAATALRDVQRATVSNETVELQPEPERATVANATVEPRSTPEPQQAITPAEMTEAPEVFTPTEPVADQPAPTPLPNRTVGMDGKSRPANMPRPQPTPEPLAYTEPAESEWDHDALGDSSADDTTPPAIPIPEGALRPVPDPPAPPTPQEKYKAQVANAVIMAGRPGYIAQDFGRVAYKLVKAEIERAAPDSVRHVDPSEAAEYADELVFKMLRPSVEALRWVLAVYDAHEQRQGIRRVK